MSDKIQGDLAEMKKKLSEYIDKGRVVRYDEVKEEPVIAVKPDVSKIIPLKRMGNCSAHFLAVDCSTRTLKRAHNWGIYLLRSAYALVRGRDVDWGYEEGMCTAIGSSRVRRDKLRNARLNRESEMALNVLCKIGEGDYLILDGASLFGGKRRFWLSLYHKCNKRGIRLLTISKQSPMLHDERGRDFIATAQMLAQNYGIWTYYPIKKADPHINLYGDVSIVKLCQDSRRIFRCDIMEYLTGCSAHELLSPLTTISEDPRCLGYPVTLWLAHDFSRPSDSMLLHFYVQVEEMLANAGLLERLRMEELSCNFPDTLHRRKYPFEQERIEYV